MNKQVDMSVQPEPCPYCDNSGATVVSVTLAEHGCCGNLNYDGSCCGDAIQVPVQGFDLEQCRFCYENENSVFNRINQS